MQLNVPCMRGYNVFFSFKCSYPNLFPFSFPFCFSFYSLFIWLQNKATLQKQPLTHVFSFRYPNPESFALDVRLVFDNCETFNEDDSDIGRAGHSMRKYFEKKWTDTSKVSWSYNLSLFFSLLNKDKWDQQCELYLHKCARHIHNDFFSLK